MTVASPLDTIEFDYQKLTKRTISCATSRKLQAMEELFGQENKPICIPDQRGSTV